MTFAERVVGALKLDANTFEDIERDTTAMGQAVGIIALAAAASSLGQVGKPSGRPWLLPSTPVVDGHWPPSRQARAGTQIGLGV